MIAGDVVVLASAALVVRDRVEEGSMQLGNTRDVARNEAHELCEDSVSLDDASSIVHSLEVVPRKRTIGVALSPACRSRCADLTESSALIAPRITQSKPGRVPMRSRRATMTRRSTSHLASGKSAMGIMYVKSIMTMS